MMKSIFLADSKVLDNKTSTISSESGHDYDNEYIMVDCTPSFDYDDDTHSQRHEEEEYDYCDDAISEGMQSDQGYTCSFTFSLTEEMILEEAREPSIQQILDEAHKSASQLVSTTEQEACQGLDKPHEPINQVPGILESSASDVSVQSSKTATEPSNGTIAKAPPSPQPHCGPETQPQQSLLGGRMSNKKRRKKIKLLKKAAAAAKAAAALSSDIPQSANHTTTTPIKSSSSTKKSTKSHPTTRYQSKRVANVAVACATETLASYKAELKATSKKVY